MKKILAVLILMIVFVSASTFKVSADEALSLDSLGVDLTIARKDDTNFGSPEKIVVVPIPLNLSIERLNTHKWLKGLFYYTIDRLGFQDIPFHYIVTNSGEVYNGNTSGDEKKIFIDGLGDRTIVVGYLSSVSANSIDPSSQTALADLLINIANRNIINPAELSISGVKFVKDKEKNTTSMKIAELSDSWKTSFNPIAERVRASYAPVSKEYSVEVVEVVLPKEAATPGETVTASIKIKNIGRYGLYQDSNSEIILAKEGNGASNFSINNQWLSQSQTTLMKEGQSLLPGKEAQFDIPIKVPLSNGEYAEDFILKTFGGANIASEKVTLKLTLKDTGKQIVEIKANNQGYFNVMESPNSSKVLRKVTAGERFFLLEVNNETLWAKIELEAGVVGWVAVWSFKYI